MNKENKEKSETREVAGAGLGLDLCLCFGPWCGLGNQFLTAPGRAESEHRLF
jgi:hypothetical protein